MIGTIAARCPGVEIQELGHSDPSGNPSVNLRLSQERAEAVITRISAAGIDTSKFTALGMGSAQPSSVTGIEQTAYYDRRIEFVVVDVAQTAALTTPAITGGIVLASKDTACVVDLQTAIDTTSIAYALGSVTV